MFRNVLTFVGVAYRALNLHTYVHTYVHAYIRSLDSHLQEMLSEVQT